MYSTLFYTNNHHFKKELVGKIIVDNVSNYKGVRDYCREMFPNFTPLYDLHYLFSFHLCLFIKKLLCLSILVFRHEIVETLTFYESLRLQPEKSSIFNNSIIFSPQKQDTKLHLY